MRRLSALVVALLAAGTAAAATPQPRLQVVDTAPLTVHATQFRPAEHVRLTAILTGQGRYVRLVTAGKKGGFTVRFRGVEPGDCGSYRIVAVGDKGSRATRSMPLPPCGAAP